MSTVSKPRPEMTAPEVDREVRAIFTDFARQFKDLPGISAAEKADVFIAQYITLYRAGYRAADNAL